MKELETKKVQYYTIYMEKYQKNCIKVIKLSCQDQHEMKKLSFFDESYSVSGIKDYFEYIVKNMQHSHIYI